MTTRRFRVVRRQGNHVVAHGILNDSIAELFVRALNEQSPYDYEKEGYNEQKSITIVD